MLRQSNKPTRGRVKGGLEDNVEDDEDVFLERARLLTRSGGLRGRVRALVLEC